MNIRKPINLVDTVIDEVALEGLDGITLEALWQRLAISFGDSLPLKTPFMEQIWQICLEIHDFSFFELETPREKLVIFDLYELEYLNTDKQFEPKDIYPHNPVEDTKLNVRGSCSSYHTRTNISDVVRNLSLSEVDQKYGQKLVIVASQTLREKALIPDHVSPTLQLTLTHYCFLERVGRSRRIGEVTIKKSSNIKEDAKALFYIRKGLHSHGLIRKQVYFQRNSGSIYNGQNTGTLVHLTRFFNTRKPKVILWAEHLINYLKSKENCAAEYNEVKNELNLDYSFKKFFKIHLLKNVFKTDVRVPYRSYYPNSVEKEWQIKSNTKERVIRLITLSDPNIEMNDIWRTEEVKEVEDRPELNIQNQKINTPFLQQFYKAVEAKEFKGASQMELAAELGFTKLISRTLTRNLVKTKIVSTYLDDIGRQRTTKFVSKKFDEKSSFKKQLEKEISKIKEFSRSIPTEKATEKLSNNIDEQNVSNNIKEQNDSSNVRERHSPNNIEGQNVTSNIEEYSILNNIEEQNLSNIKEQHIPTCTEDQNVQNDVITDTETSILTNKVNTVPEEKVTKSDNFKDQMFDKVNNIFRKYKLSRNQRRYQYTSSTKTAKTLMENKECNRTMLEKSTNIEDIEKSNKTEHLEVHSETMAEEPEKTKSNEEVNHKNKSITKDFSDKNENIVDSDFYKTIETKLIIQKPECKKKSQKIAVVGFMENVNNFDDKQPNLSYRLLRRANLVIQTVKENKIIEDMQKLIKIINTEEDKEGLDSRIDKNSLIRLLQKLVEDNFIKNIRLILKNRKQTVQKVINFICDPSIDVNHSVIQSAVEQAKLKFCMMEANSRNIKVVENVEKSPLNAVPHKKELSEEKTYIFYRDNSLGKKYGYSPKFIRMKTMHIFLYYLIYGHPGKTVSKDILLENLRQEDSMYNDLIDDDMNIYTTDINWKMFIPPLPEHRGYPKGWALMCDVLLRIPLSIFVKILNVNFEVPGLQEFLDHPIKQHILVKDLPTSIRNLLFVKRKYMFSSHEIVTRLCYIGLIQFGPQMLKEKDQVFIYLNRHTELLDTTSSAAGYHKVEDKPYPMTKFTFTSIDVVENYWYELWNTCINTCLGGRSVVEGKDILLEDLSRKVEMIQATKVRQPNEAEKYDTGFVPGDRKGAAGIDSAFFPHLKRNWNWVSITQKDVTKKENRPAAIKPTKAKTLNTQVRKTLQAKKRCSPLKQTQVKSSTSDSSKTTDTSKPSSQPRIRHAPLLVSSGKPTKVIRKMLPRKPKRKRVKYDEIDFSALQRMDKLRVDWEQHEDNILLVCKVAMVYLCPNPRRNLVSFTAVRDILRSYSFSSYNKTSRACQRRLLYMFKQPKTVNSVLLGVEEIKQDYYINKRFGAHVNSVRGDNEDPVEYENRIEKVFKELVMYIAKKYYNISNMEQRDPVTVPKTIQEFNIFYKLKLPTKTITSPGISKEVREVNDIHTATINSVIHSSMCCGKERRSWAYQLFKVYQQYPEYLLRNAMLKIRADQMVTMKKNYMCAYKKFGNCMPMSSSQYQLSSAYYYKFQTKWPYEVFSESYNILLSLFDNYVKNLHNPIDGVEVKPRIGGIVTTIHDFVGTNNMDIDIEIPDQIIMLDPGLPEKDEVYQRIALRYQSILESLSSDYNDHLKNTASEHQLEDKNFQDDANTAEHVNTTNEEQSFVEIRSAKRSLEHDYCHPQTKKQKLDNPESQDAVENNSTVNDSVMEIIDQQIQSIMESSFKNQFENNESQETLSLVKCDNVNNQFFSCEEMDIDYSNEQVISVAENVNIDIQSFSSEPMDSDNHNNKSESIVKNNTLTDDHITEKSESSATNANDTSIDCLNENKGSTNLDIQSFYQTHGDNKTVKKDSMQPFSEHHVSTDSTQNVTSEVETNKVTIIRVSDLLKKIEYQDTTKDTEMRTEIHDVRTRQTRIAMLKMREELHDLTFHDSHHAHEYFVVNSLKLLCSLLANEEEKKDVTCYQGMELPKKLLPINVEMVNKVLDNVKKFAVFPKNPLSLEDFKKETVEMKLSNWDHVNAVCKFIKVKAEFGATLHELVTCFDYLNNELADILLLLSEKRIVLRAGIVAVRYIYHRYVNPWIIHSYKILRLEKESHQTVPEGSVYVLDNDDNNEEKEKESKRVTTAANLFYNSSIESKSSESLRKNLSPQKERSEEINEVVQNEVNTEPQINDVLDETKVSEENNSQVPKVESTDENDGSPKRRLRRNRTVLLKQKDIYRAAKLLDFNTAEEIKVVIKPWIRIDGVVNRRVLDRMLGAVLCYCIEKPGISLTAVQNRFTPAIQPYHTRELIEILVKLECIKTIVQKITKVTLFSKPAKLSLGGNPDLVADSDQIIIEPTLQATLRFGMFLSNRSYNLDFLSSL